jgi:hypothetical protein
MTITERMQALLDELEASVRTQVVANLTERYDYSFVVWVASGAFAKCPRLGVLFAQYPRVTMTYTPQEFEEFRASMAEVGFALRHIYRTPHQPEEAVP